MIQNVKISLILLKESCSKWKKLYTTGVFFTSIYPTRGCTWGEKRGSKGRLIPTDSWQKECRARPAPWTGITPILATSARYRPSSGPLWHVYWAVMFSCGNRRVKEFSYTTGWKWLHPSHLDQNFDSTIRVHQSRQFKPLTLVVLKQECSG